MSIWIKEYDLTLLNEMSKNNMVSHLGIEFIEIGPDYLVATMPVDHRTQQPMGLMHGGASCTLAETVGSMAANGCVDLEQFYCVGLDINTNHLRPVQKGIVTAIAKPLHLGRTTQVWSIDILGEHQKLVSVSRLTMAVIKK